MKEVIRKYIIAQKGDNKPDIIIVADKMKYDSKGAILLIVDTEPDKRVVAVFNSDAILCIRELEETVNIPN